MQIANTNRLLVTANEIAEMVGVSSRTIWRWDSSGKVPKPIRIGKAVRWRRQDIDEWVKDGCPPRQAKAQLTRTRD